MIELSKTKKSWAIKMVEHLKESYDAKMKEIRKIEEARKDLEAIRNMIRLIGGIEVLDGATINFEERKNEINYFYDCIKN